MGDWSGEVDCGDYAMDVDLTLEWGEGEYEGTGELDCTDGYGGPCQQTFDLEVDADGFLGETELDVDLDDCEYTLYGSSGQVGCDNPDDVVWDGADLIEGEWGDCDVELKRD